MAEVVMRAEQITKRFGGTVALDRVDFNVYRGKVNVLIGENGAGKSTLMKILAGVEQPTAGRLLLDGQPISFRDTKEANRHGIGIIYQELNLFPNLSITENIFVAREKTRHGLVDMKEQARIARGLLERLEHPIDPGELVGNLPLGLQQIVEIAKALAQDVRVLIMDEPTSALSNAEVKVLFRIIEELKAQGVSIIYISHKLDELLQIGDYVTVLRDGRLIDEAPAAAVDVNWIIDCMVGRNRASMYQAGQRRTPGEELLKVEHLTLVKAGGKLALDDVSLSVRGGEIVGIYGLMGAGRTELFETLSGLHPEATGQVTFRGRAIARDDIATRIDQGLVLVPEDRQRAGIVSALSIAQNMTLASLRRYVRRFWLSRRAERQRIDEAVKELGVKTNDPDLPILSLSGGNQQKVVVAKGLLTDPKLLLMDEPTRGIDVGAKAEMFQIMNRLAAQGLGVLFASSELTEVLAMSDRILVMSKGKITGQFARGEATEAKLVAASAVGHELARTGTGGSRRGDDKH